MLLPGLREFILSDSSVTDIIGQRLYFGVNLDNPPTFPFLEMFDIPSTGEYSFDRKVMDITRIQFNHIGEVADCDRSRDALKQLLHTYVGLLPDGTRVVKCEESGGMATRYLPDPRMFMMSQDFVFWTTAG